MEGGLFHLWNSAGKALGGQTKKDVEHVMVSITNKQTCNYQQSFIPF